MFFESELSREDFIRGFNAEEEADRNYIDGLAEKTDWDDDLWAEAA